MSQGNMNQTAAETEPSAFFSGSYRRDDVRILLKPISVEPVGIAEKERLIQSGRRHYSEMLSRENLPSPRYMEIFREAFALNRRRMALDLLNLAAIIGAGRNDEITLVSLARAGTPIGVALKHILQRFFSRGAEHYSISIIRDRGIDTNALRFILDNEARSESGIVFVDGWSGKGVIARELRKYVHEFDAHHGTRLDCALFVLTDLAGVGIAPSDDDYLIPSSILNSTVSGLISRSILNGQIGPNDFHGCVYYREFEAHDLSTWFIDEIVKAVSERIDEGYTPSAEAVDPVSARCRSQRLLEDLRARFGIADENLVKPGIGEATRVLLRRVPERVIVRDEKDPAVAHLLQLAREKGVVWTTETALPYRAVSLIKGITDA
jgi:hypothetical protein